MNPWQILGIHETGDKSEIKKAYAKMLKKYHPEDDPDGFMKLRLAYEEVLKMADYIAKRNFSYPVFEDNNNSKAQEISEEHGETELKRKSWESIDIFQDEPKKSQENSAENCFDKMLLLYKDVFKRRDIKQWQQLFLEFSMDEYQLIYRQAAYFFNNNRHLPHDVWKYLDKEFNLCNNKAFKWACMVQCDFGQSFDYLDPNFNCNYYRYIKLRFSAFEGFRKMDYANSIKSAIKTEKLYNKDPVLYRTLGMSYYMLGDYENSIIAISKALEIKNDDTDCLTNRGNAYLKINELLPAVKDFEQAVKLDSNNLDARKGMVKCLYRLKKYRKANKLMENLYKTSQYDIELDILLYQRYGFEHLAGPSQLRSTNGLPQSQNKIIFQMIFRIIVAMFGLVIILGIILANPLLIPVIIVMFFASRSRR